LENLSRRIVHRVNLVVMVTDPTGRGFETVRRLHALAGEMEITYDNLAIVVNRLRRQEFPAAANELKAATGADIIVGFPEDEDVLNLSEQNGNLKHLSPDNRLFAGIDRLLEIILREF
jgi:CO dehydrogenase nickel-insertion accessory protein CooC1